MKQIESYLYIAILGMVGLFSIYLQSFIFEEEVEEVKTAERHDPDYYILNFIATGLDKNCLLYTSPSPRDLSTSRMPSSA